MIEKRKRFFYPRSQMGRAGAGNSIFASAVAAPSSAPAAAAAVSGVESDREGQHEYWRRFDNSIDAVYFGFVATAILISMFLVMAIFERFLRGGSRSTADDAPSSSSSGGVETGKNNHPSPKMTVYPNGVSVLMPGEKIPTFIAHPAPAPCPPECIT